MAAKEEVFKSNMRLVFSIGKNYVSRVIHMQFIDIIQEGMLGLWRSIETYNPEKSAFSTYATTLIVRQIDRAIEKEEETLCYPSNKIREGKKLISLIREEDLTDNEICEKLQISPKTLEHLKQKSQNRIVSINKKINDEENGATLEDIIADESTLDSYEKVINQETDQRLLSFFRYTLSPYEYFILYYRILIPEPITQEKIANELGITREGIRQKEERLKRKLKYYFKDNQKEYINMLKSIGVLKLEKIKTAPLTPRDITRYLYLRPILSNIEYAIYYDLYIKKETFCIQDTSYKLGITYEEMQKYLVNIKGAIENIDREDYETYHKDLTKLYKSSIYTFANEHGKKVVAYTYLKKKYNYTLKDFLSLYHGEWEELSTKEQFLLEKYFEGTPKEAIQKMYTNRFLNVLLYGYRKRDTRLPFSKLKEAYLKKKNEFCKDHQLIIENIILGNMSRKEFNRLYGTNIDAEDISCIIFRLEKMYYHIDHYMNNSFDKEKYLEIKRKYPDKVVGEKEELLDLYFGVKGERYSIEEIGERLHIPYPYIANKISSAYKSIINLYANKSCSLNINKKIYLPYITDPKMQFAENIKEILILFFLKDQTYEEIEKITGLPPYDISNKITTAFRRIDFIRYHITTPFSPESDLLEEIIKKPSLFSAFEKKIIEEKYIDYFTIDKIAEQNGVSKEEVAKIICRFNKIYRKYLIKDVVLERNDIEKELSKHPSESILTEVEKRFVSYFYGIKNQYNQEGVKLNKKEITQRLNLPSSHSYRNMKTSIEKKLKHNKIGTYTDTICYIKRIDLEEYLKDVHLPISRKEREIICYLFELNSYPYKSMGEIAILYNECEQSIYNRYLRTILAILKYKNREIPGTINYEYDILPNIRYFPQNDRILIDAYYHHQLTLEEIAEKYKQGYNYVKNRINKINIKLFEIIEKRDTKLFDFDYLETHWQDTDFPFDGNKVLAKEIFDLYFGNSGIENLALPAIISKLKLDKTPSRVCDMIGRFMLASKKHQDKIYKEKTFTLDEIVNYYNSEKQHMAEYKKKIYECHIKATLRCKNRKVANIPIEILYDLIRAKYDGGTDIFALKREAAIELLGRYKKQLVPTVKKTIMSYYHISYRELLSGQELLTVYKILDKMDRKEKEEQKSLSLSGKPIEK